MEIEEINHALKVLSEKEYSLMGELLSVADEKKV